MYKKFFEAFPSYSIKEPLSLKPPKGSDFSQEVWNTILSFIWEDCLDNLIFCPREMKLHWYACIAPPAECNKSKDAHCRLAARHLHVLKMSLYPSDATESDYLDRSPMTQLGESVMLLSSAGGLCRAAKAVSESTHQQVAMCKDAAAHQKIMLDAATDKMTETSLYCSQIMDHKAQHLSRYLDLTMKKDDVDTGKFMAGSASVVTAPSERLSSTSRLSRTSSAKSSVSKATSAKRAQTGRATFPQVQKLS